jgi:predicted enzyme related to lactoylglutathione lyase
VIGHPTTLQVAGGHDVLVYEKPDNVPATFTVLHFQVPDIDAAVDALAAKGVAFERYDGFGQDGRVVMRGRGPLIAWFRDPAGNILSVVQSRDDS